MEPTHPTPKNHGIAAFFAHLRGHFSRHWHTESSRQKLTQLIKYLVITGLGTGIMVGLFAFFEFLVVHFMPSLPTSHHGFMQGFTVFNAAFSFVLSATWNYLLLARFTFNHDNNAATRLRYAKVAVLSLVASVVVSFVAKYVFSASDVLANASAVPFVFVISFFGHKFYSFDSHQH
jgi:putative flippase GtrA